MRTKKNQLSYIGYRITSNDNDVTYFGHEDCAYQHLERADKQLDPCRRYTTKIDAKSDEWIQCLGHSDWGGLDCWYGCGNPTKEGHTTRGNKGIVTLLSVLLRPRACALFCPYFFWNFPSLNKQTNSLSRHHIPTNIKVGQVCFLLQTDGTRWYRAILTVVQRWTQITKKVKRNTTQIAEITSFLTMSFCGYGKDGGNSIHSKQSISFWLGLIPRSRCLQLRSRVFSTKRPLIIARSLLLFILV